MSVWLSSEVIFPVVRPTCRSSLLIHTIIMVMTLKIEPVGSSLQCLPDGRCSLFMETMKTSVNPWLNLLAHHVNVSIGESNTTR